MPAAVRSPDGREHHYAFEPKRMMRLYWTPEDFARAPEWTTNARIFEEVVAAARSRGVRLIFSWAPSAPHVVLPLLRGRVPAEQLRAFAAFDEDDLPPAPEFERELFARLDSVESVFREFCARHGVEFVSPTRALRERMAAGVPVYFTYDQHWTRLGHEVVAEVLAAHLAGAHPAARP